jgi:hypothetical protein
MSTRIEPREVRTIYEGRGFTLQIESTSIAPPSDDGRGSCRREASNPART